MNFLLQLAFGLWRMVRPAASPAHPAGRIVYVPRDAGWHVRLPCTACGGALVALPASEHCTSRGAVAAGRRYVERAQADGCPNCRTLEERNGIGAPGLRVWFDTLAGEWMASLPVTGSDTRVMLPLGIGSYGADHVAVHQAATRLSSAGSELWRQYQRD
jgi:hypothetical protein